MEIQKRITEWNEIAAFLRKNVVQGEMDATGAYSALYRVASLAENVSADM